MPIWLWSWWIVLWAVLLSLFVHLHWWAIAIGFGAFITWKFLDQIWKELRIGNPEEE
jgi:hypothetical protein